MSSYFDPTVIFVVNLCPLSYISFQQTLQESRVYKTQTSQCSPEKKETKMQQNQKFQTYSLERIGKKIVNISW